MIDSEYNMGIYKSVKISIGSVIRNPKTLKIVPDHLKTKNMCKHTVKILPFVIGYAPDRYKTQKISDEEILENGGTLESVLHCYKNQKFVIKLLVITLMH